MRFADRWGPKHGESGQQRRGKPAVRLKRIRGAVKKRKRSEGPKLSRLISNIKVIREKRSETTAATRKCRGQESGTEEQRAPHN